MTDMTRRFWLVGACFAAVVGVLRRSISPGHAQASGNSSIDYLVDDSGNILTSETGDRLLAG